MEQVKVEVGDVVTYVDPTGLEHKALVTAAWSPTCVNVVFVNNDAKMTDTYGRQIERATSVIHSSTPGRAYGNYWFAGHPVEEVDMTHKPKLYSEA